MKQNKDLGLHDLVLGNRSQIVILEIESNIMIVD